jgi:hypothetical protein
MAGLGHGAANDIHGRALAKPILTADGKRTMQEAYMQVFDTILECGASTFAWRLGAEHRWMRKEHSTIRMATMINPAFGLHG